MLTRPRLLLFTGLTFFLGSLLLVPLTRFSETLGLPSTYRSKPAHRPNGVIIMLVNPTRITQMTMTLYNIEDRFNRRLKYPYVLFSSESEVSVVTAELRAKVDYITEGRATFGWYLPVIHTRHTEFTSQSLARQLRCNRKHGASPTSSVNHLSKNPCTKLGAYILPVFRVTSHKFPLQILHWVPVHVQILFWCASSLTSHQLSHIFS
jgi:hypothetical protein